MEAVPDCGPRKHNYEFKGNKTFKSMTMSARGTTVRLSQNAVYKCLTCGKVRRAPVKVGALNDSL
jgi:uncharacterized Zn finger protein